MAIKFFRLQHFGHFSWGIYLSCEQDVNATKLTYCPESLVPGAQCSWPTAHRTPWGFVQFFTFHVLLLQFGACTCTHVGCYASCLGGNDNVRCTCTHVGCCATGGVGWGGCNDDVPWTCKHGWCYTWQKWLRPRTSLQFLDELSRIWWTKSSSAQNFRPSKP